VLSLGFGLPGVSSFAQPGTMISLREEVELLRQKKTYQHDTVYANKLNQLAFSYAQSYPDSALSLLNGWPERFISYGNNRAAVEAFKISGLAHQTKGSFEKALENFEQAFTLAEKIKDKKAIPGITNNIGSYYLNQGNYTMALRQYYNGLKAAEANGDQFVVGRIYNNIGNVYFYQKNFTEAASNYKKMLTIAESMSDTAGMILAYNNIGEVALEKKNLSEALYYFTTSNQLALRGNNIQMQLAAAKNLGNVYFGMDSLTKSIDYLKRAYALSVETGNNPSRCKTLIGLTETKLKQGNLKEALDHGLEAIALAEQMKQMQLRRDSYEAVAKVYKAMGNGLLALNYYTSFKLYADSLQTFESERAAARLKAEFDFSKKELIFQRKALKQRLLLFAVIGALLGVLLLAVFIYRSRQKEKKINSYLHQQNLEIELQKEKLENTLLDLQATQKQLIQSEKMASLGELTAGIAHEIQNPLNFVNNFSEVSKELLKEMIEELDKGTIQEAKEIANDLIGNLEKINHHGERASSIVKGMLQHSRSSTGVKELTDMNALCDEYLRLAFHGLRAKDKSFNAKFETSFDESIGKTNVIPQEMGRVILNLLNNAFYAVSEKKKISGDAYEPVVTITTRKTNQGVEIKISDNGTGIPQKALDKIFQPFFTTKPTGQGTGLGLSLSYDIVTKGHGGELKVDTKEGEGTVFVINLPNSYA
jgi:signal transduction histidine kinase